jgi:spore germination cell wall hydrolase CwlJ-like protein
MISTLTCIATAVYFEARSESIDGQLLVAETIINRALDPRWPSEPCDVVKQRNQFSFYSDGLSDKPTDADAYATATAVATEALNGNHAYTGSLYYHASYVAPIWRHSLEPIAKVGTHIFYIDK